jgi:hypothetical protein
MKGFRSILRACAGPAVAAVLPFMCMAGDASTHKHQEETQVAARGTAAMPGDPRRPRKPR